MVRHQRTLPLVIFLFVSMMLLLCPRDCVAPFPTEIVIYTKEVPPFSVPKAGARLGDAGARDQVSGLTIDYLLKPGGVLANLATLAGSGVAVPSVDAVLRSVRTVVLGTNDAVLRRVGDDYCNATRQPQRLCIGAAAISITAERERDFGVDFLPSYYMSGIKLMVKEDTEAQLLSFAKDVLYILATCGVYWISTILVVAPLIWTSESYLCPPGKISIFHHCEATVCSCFALLSLRLLRWFDEVASRLTNHVAMTDGSQTMHK
eukprot:COSAG02_NODE_3058_length_7451_cov_47.724701_4_plen_262_part_00